MIARDHRGLAKNRFARKHRHHFGHDGENRENQNINFGVAKDPEDMLPEKNVAAGGRVKEISAESGGQS